MTVRLSATLSFGLLVPQRLNRIQLCRTGRRIQSREKADDYCKYDRAQYEPPWNRPDILRRQLLTAHVDRSAEIDGDTDEPAKRDAGKSTEHAHRPRLGEEQTFDV